jgi:uncharacterized protein
MSANKDSGRATKFAAAQAAGATPPRAALNDELVREYLKDNGDFLQRHPDMFDHLHIGHASGSAVSLVEKQVSVLRERNIDMRHRLKSLTSNARANDKLHRRTCQLVLKLLEADSIAALYMAFMESMQKDFEVEYASMILFGDDATGKGARVESPDTARKEIGALLRGRKPICGALRAEELAYLFASTGQSSSKRPKPGQAGSAAVMPLSNGDQLGLIAVGSSDPNYYSSSMDTLFLAHIGDVIVRLLPRLQLPGEARPSED